MKANWLDKIGLDAEKLGADHTDALMAKMNLATLLKNQGKTAEAEALYQEVIAGYTEKLGADHTDTLRVKGNLATLLDEQGKTAEAEAADEFSRNPPTPQPPNPWGLMGSFFSK